MLLPFRRLVAILLLAVLAVGGQIAPCACDVAPPAADACAGHDHSHEAPADERDCPCPTCHATCAHVAFVVVSPVVVEVATPRAADPTHPIGAAEALRSPTRDIFIPPKLG